MNGCDGCGDDLTSELELRTGLCKWCYDQQRIAIYDADDEADHRHQQALDEREDVDRG